MGDKLDTEAPELYRVKFSPESLSQLLEIYRYIANVANPDIALKYSNAIMAYCESLRLFPHRGTKRDDIRPTLRIINYKKTCVIAFFVKQKTVFIIGIFYGGQNLAKRLIKHS